MYDCMKDKKVDDDILKGEKMESHDYDLLQQEQKEQQDRELHEEYLAEFRGALEGCICQAQKDGLTLEEIEEAIKKELKRF